MRITLDLPDEFIKVVKDATGQLGVTVSEFICNKLIDDLARQTAYFEVYGKPSAFLTLPFVKDPDDGTVVTGDALLEYLKDIYFKLYAAQVKPDDSEAVTWQ